MPRHTYIRPDVQFPLVLRLLLDCEVGANGVRFDLLKYYNICNNLIRMVLNLKELRKAKGWSQTDAARRLRVSQPYVSLLENGVRELTPELAQRLLRTMDLSPTGLPLPRSLDTWPEVTNDAVVKQLASLEYKPFAYVRTRVRQKNPAAVLLWALTAKNLEPRLLEALPWLLLHFNDLPVTWLVREAKVHDLQNRLGLVASLAKDVARRDRQFAERLESLTVLVSILEQSRLAREDTLCEAEMPARTREFLRQSRSREAEHWNMLTGWKVEHLNYDA